MATKNKLSKAVLAILMACALAALAALAACSSPQASSSSSSSTSQVMSVSDTAKSSAANYPTTGAYNILVLGNDQWESSDPGNPDMICVMRVDLDQHKVTLVTVPRDTRVINEKGNPDKLNFTMSGKPFDQQMKLVEEATGIKCDHYVQIHFDGLEKLVDAIGGLPIDLPFSCDYSFYTEDYPNEQFEAGEQTLNGWRAMAISRARTGYGDQGLDNEDVIRQYVCREMLTNLMQYAYTGGVEHAADTLTKFQNLVETDIPLEQQIAWAKKLGETGSIKVLGVTGPYNGTQQDDAGGMWLVNSDPEGWSSLVDAIAADGDLSAAVDTYEYHEMPGGLPNSTETTIKVG